MTGMDSYKEFDTSSIVTNTTSKESVLSFGRLSFRKRDVLLGGVAIVALLCVIILAIVLAAQSGRSNNSSCDVHTSSGQTGSIPKETDDDALPFCVTTECLKAAVHQKPMMDPSIDPCDDFYGFACGHYPKQHPQSQFLVDVTSEKEILNENTREIVYILGSDTDVQNQRQHSYERKLKDFMHSCSNHFDKMDLRGRPLVEKVIEPLGGWYVLGTYNNDTFNFHDTLKKVHVDYWTAAFFSLTVKTDTTNWNRKIIELSFAGMRLDFRLYQPLPLFLPVQAVYKSYMKVLANLVSVDANVTPNDDLINQFAEDAYEVEEAISRILQNVTVIQDNHAPDKRMSLGQLQEHLNHTLMMVDYMKTLFNEWPSKFDSNTKVAITLTGYFDRLGQLIASYLETEEGKRKLHNYLMWQVVERYSRDLSWDYIHTKRKLNHLIYGFKDDSSGYQYCFNVAQQGFAKAMSAVFVKKHIKDIGKKEASAMMKHIRDVFIDAVKTMGWMRSDDQDTAIKKIMTSIYKIGYPDDIVDENYMDNYYYHVKINRDSYFGNLLGLNVHYKKQMNNLIGRADSKAQWAYHVFDPVVKYFNPWSELVVTAAMLQNPLFDANGPTYYNYGGIGSRIATNLIHAIDEYGSSFKLDGSHFGVWWSNFTTRHYADIRQCAIDAQKNEVIGPFLGLNVNTSSFAPYWAPEVLAVSSGVRMAYKAYNQLQKSKGMEKLPPGFHKYNPDQMFFLSYAQSYCQNAPDRELIAHLRRNEMTNKHSVNMAVKNIPEFRATFNCPKLPSMQSNKCLLFGA